MLHHNAKICFKNKDRPVSLIPLSIKIPYSVKLFNTLTYEHTAKINKVANPEQKSFNVQQVVYNAYALCFLGFFLFAGPK